MMNYNAMLSGLRDLVDNPTPRVPVLLCLDTSGSMMGAPIHELNLGVLQKRLWCRLTTVLTALPTSTRLTDCRYRRWRPAE